MLGANVALFLQRTHKEGNGMVNLAQQRQRRERANELMSMLLLFLLSLYMVVLQSDLQHRRSVRKHENKSKHLTLSSNY